MIVETLAKVENRIPGALVGSAQYAPGYVTSFTPDQIAEMEDKRLEEEKRYREQEWAKIGAFFAVRSFADTLQNPEFNLADKEKAWEASLQKGEALVEKAMQFNLQPYEFSHLFRAN